MSTDTPDWEVKIPVIDGNDGYDLVQGYGDGVKLTIDKGWQLFCHYWFWKDELVDALKTLMANSAAIVTLEAEFEEMDGEFHKVELRFHGDDIMMFPWSGYDKPKTNASTRLAKIPRSDAEIIISSSMSML